MKCYSEPLQYTTTQRQIVIFCGVYGPEFGVGGKVGEQGEEQGEEELWHLLCHNEGLYLSPDTINAALIRYQRCRSVSCVMSLF